MSNLRVPASRSEPKPTPSRDTGPTGRSELTPFRALLDGRPKVGPAHRGPAHSGPAHSGSAHPGPARPTAESGVLAPRLGADRRLLSDRERSPSDHAGELPHASRDALAPTPDVAPLSLEPFRVNNALLPPQGSPSPLARDNHDAAFALASELVESMRVGRFGREGHAVSMRLRAGRGTVGVELREESGVLRLRLEGGSVSELEGLGERVRSELQQRGLALDELELA